MERRVEEILAAWREAVRALEAMGDPASQEAGTLRFRAAQLRREYQAQFAMVTSEGRRDELGPLAEGAHEP